jgi:hypothetical protein
MNYQELEVAGRFLGSVFVDTKMEQKYCFLERSPESSWKRTGIYPQFVL